MRLLPQQLTPLALATAYALLAGLGHALHDHGDCGADHAPTVSACGCHGCPAEVEPPRRAATDETHALALRTQRAGHDPDSCAACVVLAQLQVGHYATDIDCLFPPSSSASGATPACVVPKRSVAAYLARGPPARSV